MTQLEERLQTLMRDVFDNDEVVIDRELTADDVEGWDSLAHVHLIVAAEREFSIRISASEVHRLKTAGDLIDLVQAKIQVNQT
jgi:acyl carrier protein